MLDISLIRTFEPLNKTGTPLPSMTQAKIHCILKKSRNSRYLSQRRSKQHSLFTDLDQKSAPPEVWKDMILSLGHSKYTTSISVFMRDESQRRSVLLRPILDQETQVLLLPINNAIARKSDISARKYRKFPGIFLKHGTVIPTKETYKMAHIINCFSLY